MDATMKTPGARRGVLHRRHAYALIALAALTAAIGGCDCSSNNPVSPVVPLPPLSAVVLTPPADSVFIGANVSFTAAAYDTMGALVPGATFNWTSTAPAVFTVNGVGTVTGVSEGNGKVIASAGGHSDTSQVTVFPGFGWFAQSSASSANLNGVYFLSDGRTGWAVGDGGTIRKTVDAGTTWTQQISNTSFNLRSVQFATSTIGCACGANGIVMRTTNGGTTWLAVTTPASGFTLNDIYFNGNVGWAVGNGGVILRTTDAGVSWTRYLPSVTLTNLLSVAFAGLNDGWAVGDNGVIVGTHDGGTSWYIYQPSVTNAGLDAVWRRSNTLAWSVGRTGATLATTATADSLAWQSLGVPNYQLYGVHFPSDLTGYAVGFNTQNGSGLVVRTDDGGMNLEVQDSHTMFRLNDVYFTDVLHGWAVGRGGTIIHTATGGR